MKLPMKPLAPVTNTLSINDFKVDLHNFSRELLAKLAIILLICRNKTQILWQKVKKAANA
jgi:hypothetical protein